MPPVHDHGDSENAGAMAKTSVARYRLGEDFDADTGSGLMEERGAFNRCPQTPTRPFSFLKQKP